MTLYVAYLPVYGTARRSRSKRLMKSRFQVRDYVCGRGRLLAEFLDATRQDLPESLVLREARRYCREHGAVLLIATTGGPLKILPPSAARAGPQATGLRSRAKVRRRAGP